MSTDTIVSLTLVLVVLRQTREHRLDLQAFLLPLGLVGWAASHYLSGVHLGGNDPVLIAALAAAGTAVGLASGQATHLRAAADGVHARAGLVAAGLWVTSMGLRGLFVFWAGHGGADAIGRFSAAHAITSDGAWAAALIAMAVAEVATRLGLIALRAQGLRSGARPQLATA